MRISDHMLSGISFFYDSEQAADEGGRPLGTGFLVWVADEDQSKTHVYLITNDHVVQAASGLIVVRINSEDGHGPAIKLTLSDYEWFPHPEGDDVTACYFGCDIPFPASGIGFFAASQLLTRQKAASASLQFGAAHVGIGDDCLMVGCFAPHPGTKSNLPVVRFGNISLLPREPIYMDERKFDQEAFLVEMRSRGGFSGSPVFLLPPAWPAAETPVNETLGICCGHVQQWRGLRIKQKGGSVHEMELADNSGMAIVIPAWKILDILNHEDVVAVRKQAEAKAVERQRRPLTALDAAKGTRGPEPETLKISGDWTKAVKKALKRKRLR